ncbi:tellurite resistance TerB family protein [Desulfatitalea tepidiphila]|uniref:tellurite resistance TerB family protein n=1 Tax=Desulfatitalea tepidiphila TaxID=1185843 RepID=UPI0006B63A5A|nr:tellurite resistance TerB family protein [Desulfatitalea tepidiphila]
MGIGDLLGALMQSGMAPSSHQRLKNAMGGGGGLLDSLGGMLGGKAGGGGGLGDLLSGAIGGGGGGGGGLGGMLGDVLNQAGKAAGGKNNLALGGLGALAGALLGGGGKSMKGALGGGVMALLGAMAFKALKGSGQGGERVPLGLLEPQTESDRRELETQSELVLKAMINAAKADGRIDEDEIQRIVGKLQEAGAGAEEQRYVLTQMQKPMETDELILAGRRRPELAVEIFAASLMAIEVDTPAERAYMAELASGLGLAPDVIKKVEQMVGL